MKKFMLKKVAMVVSAGCLGLAVSASQAAPLNVFTNGTAADANEVNANFTELETRINTISLTPGPAGPQGPAGADGATGPTGPMGPQGIAGQNGTNGLNGLDGADGAPGADGLDGAPGADGATGPQGPAGADGVGVTFQSFEGFGAAVKWASKAFVVTQSAGSHDKEVRTMVRTPIDATTGTVVQTRQRTLAGAVIRHQVLTFNYDTAGDMTFDEIKSYNTDTTTLNNTKTLTPGVVVRHAAMGVGMNWATAFTVDKVDNIGGGAGNDTGFAHDGRSLLAIEDITVQGVPYTGCLKIQRNRTSIIMGNFKGITWNCPNDGMVKYIEVNRYSGTSSMMEFNPADASSVLNP